MALRRIDAVHGIGELLKPTSVPVSELRRRVEEAIDEQELAIRSAALLLEDAEWAQSSRDGTLALQFIRNAQKSLQAFQELPPPWRSSVDEYLYRISESNPSFDEVLRTSLRIVDDLQKRFAPRKRSGGAPKARNQKHIKLACATLALNLLRAFHEGKELSPAYHPYLRITETLFELRTGEEGADVRRACEEVFAGVHKQK